MTEEITITREIAAKAFKKWTDDYIANPDGGWGELGAISDEGQRCANFFFKLVEAVR